MDERTDIFDHAELVGPGMQTPDQQLRELLDELNRRRVPTTVGQGPLTLWQRVGLFAANPDEYNRRVVQTIEATAVVQENELPLSKDQQAAWNKIQAWLANRAGTDGSPREPWFILKGPPGTGKTFLMKKLKEVSGWRIEYTAPTNKAAKVLSRMVGQRASTIYSMLGLVMSSFEDGMVLEYPNTAPYIPKRTLIVVDEASMLNSKLCEFIRMAQEDNGCLFMFVGDPWQLNPVGENFSPAWRMTERKENTAVLFQPLRFADGPLLDLSRRIRQYIRDGRTSSPMRDDNDGKAGVFMLPFRDFEQHLYEGRNLEYYRENKVVAWRNKTVNYYNRKIRSALDLAEDFAVGETLMVAYPVKEGMDILAHIDDEFTINTIRESEVRLRGGPDVPCFVMEGDLDVVNGTKPMTFKVPIPGDKTLQIYLGKLAAIARKAKGRDRKSAWRDFWTVRETFQEVRYSYALTAHRVQGSTLKNVYVDQSDILSNPNKKEALFALNVADTRATTAVYTY